MNDWGDPTQKSQLKNSIHGHFDVIPRDLLTPGAIFLGFLPFFNDPSHNLSQYLSAWRQIRTVLCG